MFRVILLSLTVLLGGCAFPAHIQMAQLHGAGKPDQAVELFHKDHRLDDSDEETLMALCSSLHVMNEFGKYDECLSAYAKETDTGIDTSLVETHRAGMYFRMGNYKKAREQATLAIADDKNPLPLGAHEWLARVAAKEGNVDEAHQWMKKLDELKARVFGISIGEDILGEVKRDSRARIYMDLNQPGMAEKELKKPLPGKSLGEYIFMGVIDFLETDADRVANTLSEWTAPKGTENWRLMMEVQTLWMYGQVAFANDNYRDSIQSFRRMLNVPNIEKMRIFYVDGLYYLARAYRGYGDADKADQYAVLLKAAVAEDAGKIPWPAERESFKALYAL